MANDEFRDQQRECPGCGQDGIGVESHNDDCPRHPVNSAGLIEKSADVRAEFERNRSFGLKARHETRVERAIRRAVGEEIAAAFETQAALPSMRGTAIGELLLVCAATARDIGARETS